MSREGLECNWQRMSSSMNGWKEGREGEEGGGRGGRGQ